MGETEDEEDKGGQSLTGQHITDSTSKHEPCT